MAGLADKRKFFIDGAWVEALAGQELEVIDPSTEEAVAVISLGGQADTDAAVAAAKRAFPAWSATSKEERLALMRRVLEVYEKRAGEMGRAISLEMGAPIDMAVEDQAGSGSSHIRNFIRAFEGF